MDAVESMVYSMQGTLGGVPWHGKGVSVQEAITSEQAWELSGQNWDVALGPVWGGPQRRLIQDKRCVYRMTDNKVLGVVGAGYRPIQNREMFTFLDSLVQDRVLRYNTAGVLHGGSVVWMLAEMPDDVLVAGEKYHDFLLCTSGHDNQHKMQVLPTRKRVVCHNTLQMALGAKGFNVEIKHSGNIAAKLDLAKQILNVTTEQQRRYTVWLEQLAETPMPVEQRATLHEGLFGTLDNDTPLMRRLAMARWRDIFEEENKLRPDTAYAVLQTITGYADHALQPMDSRVNKGDERMLSFLKGGSKRFKDKGIGLLTELTGVAVHGDDA